MTIANRSELRQQIVDFLGDRQDLTTTQLNISISLGEKEIDRSLRTLGAEDETDLILTNKKTNLPSDFKGMRRVYLDANPANVLQFYSADNFWRFDRATKNSQPLIYTIEGDNSEGVKKLVVSPTPDATYTAKLLYFKKISLQNDTDTNTFLQEYEDVYLYGCLKHAAILLQDPNSAAGYNQVFQNALRDVILDDKKQRQGSGPLVTKPAYREGPYDSFN